MGGVFRLRSPSLSSCSRLSAATRRFGRRQVDSQRQVVVLGGRFQGLVSRNQWILTGWSGLGRESTDNVIDNRGLGSRLQQILAQHASGGLVSTGYVRCGVLVAVIVTAPCRRCGSGLSSHRAKPMGGRAADLATSEVVRP